jgi:hypothetical protein
MLRGTLSSIILRTSIANGLGASNAAAAKEYVGSARRLQRQIVEFECGCRPKCEPERRDRNWRVKLWEMMICADSRSEMRVKVLGQ